MKYWFQRLLRRKSTAAEDAAFHQRMLAQHGLIIVCSKLCIGPDRLPVRHAVREESKNPADSGWILASGTESPEFVNDPKNYVLVPMDRMIATDETLRILYEQSIGSELTRKHANEPWRWIVDDKVIDQDGKVLETL